MLPPLRQLLQQIRGDTGKALKGGANACRRTGRHSRYAARLAVGRSARTGQHAQ